jgi:integrase
MATDEGRIERLTKSSVDDAMKGPKRFIVWDADLKGFGLRVEPSGVKTFIIRYRIGGGRRGTRKQFKIGRYGPLTTAEARKRAEGALADVEHGRDPQAERAKGREALSVAELCDLYLAEGVATKKASTIALDRGRVAGHIKPGLGSRKITELGKADVERWMADVAAGQVRANTPGGHVGPRPAGSMARGGKAAATKSVKLLRVMFKFAIGRKLCGEDPCVGVKTFADGRRERFLSPAELGTLGDALTAAEANGALPAHVAIIRLLALTGARKNEIARLRWSEVDAGRGLLQLDDSKTGRRAIRMGAAALELIAALPRSKTPYVFPDPRDPTLPIRNLDWAWVGIRKRAGMPELRIHDLRHSFASVGVAGGAGLLLIGKLLGHTHVATTSRYAHLADDPVKAAADRISGAVSAALSGKPGDLSQIWGAG